jgi:dihydrofolate reductase
VRRVIVSEFVSLDGVVEAPDQWHFPYWSDEMGQEIGAAMGQVDAMLMGRVLYEEWAAFWPQQNPEENPVADHMNGVQKYVVSTTLEEPLEWDNSTLIKGNVAEEIAELKRQAGGDISISGSPTLVRSLLEDGLIDELRLMVHPVVVGGGKRLFEEGDRVAFELVDSKTFSMGVVYLTYRPAGKEAEGQTEYERGESSRGLATRRTAYSPGDIVASTRNRSPAGLALGTARLRAGPPASAYPTGSASMLAL